MKKLKDVGPAFGRFRENFIGLGHKLGPILFQLPPAWNLNLERFESFLRLLDKEFHYAFEFRNETWYDENVYRLLENHNCAFCIYELNGHISPEKVTAGFVYIRLHGPGGKYQGSYDDASLSGWCNKIDAWRSSGKDVYVYFDNDDRAFAAANAKRLIEITSVARKEKRLF
jgi:uncharacterized protein YecE (DUF72 family)